MNVLLFLLAVQNQPMRCGTALFDRIRAAEPVAVPVMKREATPPRLGETRLMWLQNMSVMPPQQFQADMTCRGIGPHCYVMVDDSSWDAGLADSADVARIVERFDFSSPRDSDAGVWDHNTTVLGEPPDAIDNDSAIYLLYYNVGTFHSYSFDGFWQYFDEYYDTTAIRLWGYHSNEVECVYLDLYPNNPAEDYRIAIGAHEFGHMIHWNYDKAESLWVSEGCCELAMWLFGSPDPISGFNGNSDNDLTQWTGEWSDYIKTYLYFLFLYEQYGGRVGTDLVHNIVANPYVSIEGIDSAFAATGLPQRFEELLDHWVLTNIINDTGFAQGRYGYYGEMVPRFSQSSYHSSYPVSRTGSLSRWAGEYILFQRGRELELTFDGADDGDFRLYVVGKDTLLHETMLDTVPLDPSQAGSASVPGSVTVYQWVYLVPVNHYPWGTVGYAYGATATGIAEDRRAAEGMRPLSTNLLRVGMELQVAGEFEFVSGDGRVVARGRDVLCTRGLSTGVYWLRATGSIAAARRVLLAR